MRFKLFKKDDIEVEYEDNFKKKSTEIDLKSVYKEVDLGNNFIVSGFLKYNDGDNDNPLVNKGIVIFINGNFTKTLISNGEGYFKDYFLAKSPGEYNVTAYYDGNWEYEKSSSSFSIKVVEPPENRNMQSDDDALEKLERIVKMYQQGFLSENEFKALKEKIIK